MLVPRVGASLLYVSSLILPGVPLPGQGHPIREHRRQQAARRLRAGRDWFATDLVFTHPDGRPLSSWAVSRRFAELGQAAGLPPLGLNEARRRAALPERELVPRRR